MVHEVVHDKAVRGLSAEPTTHHPHPPATGKKNGAAGTAPDLQLKRGQNTLVTILYFNSVGDHGLLRSHYFICQ